MNKYTVKELDDHIDYLKKNVFFVNTKWSHFDILFKDLIKLSKTIKKNTNIVFLERGGLYGNLSIWAPLFQKGRVKSIDCSSKIIRKRGPYNKKYVENNKIIKWPTSLFTDYKKINLKKNSVDLIIIPNLLHHISEHDFLIKKCFNFLKKGGKLYIFEPVLREIHQKPDDFVRFTPYGIKKLVEKTGFKVKKINTSGGPFSAIIYCWDQALQYLPNNIAKKNGFLLNQKKIDLFLKLEKKYKKNRLRINSSFPVSFSILSQKI